MGIFSLTQELAIDLGTANTLIIYNGKVVVDEPSIVALDVHTGKLVAIGQQARQMHEKTNPNIKTIRPLKDGVIADFNATELMLRGMIKKVKTSGSLFAPSLRMVICIPSGSTNVEIRAVRDSAEHAGGREVYMIYEPMAAALGAGLDVEAPEGNMVIDIGAVKEGRFADTAALANWYYGHKVTVAIANTQEKTTNGNPLIARISQTDWTDKTIDATLADPAAQATVFSLAGEVTEKVTYDDLSGTVHVGDKVGSVTLKQDGTKIAVMDLVADEEDSGPNPIEWLLVKLDRLGRRIDNRPLTAESETIAKAPEV